MKRAFVETDAIGSNDDSETESIEEEEKGLNGPKHQVCCYCQAVGGRQQPGRKFLKLRRALFRLLIGSFYLVFIILSIRRVKYVLTLSTDKHEMAWTIGGAFVVATVPISLYQIFQHLSNFVEPRQQTHVIRMISMVPLYAIQSWFSLRYQNLSLYTQCVREAYESYVIYAFVQYLISYMGSEEQLILKLQTKPAVLGRHLSPFCCLPPWTMGAEFLHRCKRGVLQYLAVRLATLLLTFILEYLDLYGEGEYSMRRGFFWVTVINCISQTWALYILILFYHATHKELMSINPCGKFFSIKSVVFASWWQSLFIGLMVHQGTIGELDSHSAEMVAKGVQDLLICTEMLMAAIAFTFSFPVSDFVVRSTDAEVGYNKGCGSAYSHRKLLGAGQELDENDGSITAGENLLQQHQSGKNVSIWTALWTSCVPMDVREEFKLAVHQCLEEDFCCLPRRFCWPCKCKIKCGSWKHHHRHNSKRSAPSSPTTSSGRCRASSSPTSSSAAGPASCNTNKGDSLLDGGGQVSGIPTSSVHASIGSSSSSSSGSRRFS